MEIGDPTDSRLLRGDLDNIVLTAMRKEPEAIRLTNYQKSLAIREVLLGKDPSNAKLQRSVALSLLKVGAVSDPHRREAAAAIRRGVTMLETLAAADPNDGRARRAVGFGCYQLRNALFAAGDFPGALESRQKAFAIREQFAANDPQNAQARFDLAVAYTDLPKLSLSPASRGRQSSTRAKDWRSLKNWRPPIPATRSIHATSRSARKNSATPERAPARRAARPTRSGFTPGRKRAIGIKNRTKFSPTCALARSASLRPRIKPVAALAPNERL